MNSFFRSLYFDTLKNFSDGELRNLVGGENIVNYERISDTQIEKKQLINYAMNQQGLQFLEKKEDRNFFISRMTKDSVKSLFKKICEYEKITFQTTDYYTFIKDFIDDFHHHFEAIIGIEEDEKKDKRAITKSTPSYPLYPYQINISNTVLDLIGSNSIHNKCIIHMPTGSGKTRTAMNIVCDFLRRNPNQVVVWLADREELCIQASNEFLKAWGVLGNKPIKQYLFVGNEQDSSVLGGIDEGFIVAGTQKVYSGNKSDFSILYRLLAEKTSLIVFDEAHKIIAPTHKQISDLLLEGTGKGFLIGLTATPGRSLINGKNETDKELTNYFQNNKVNMTVAGYISPIEYLVENEYLANSTFIQLDYLKDTKLTFNKDHFNKNKAEVLSILSDVDSRNKEIIRIATEEVERDSKIIIFACTVEHARELSTYLCLAGCNAASIDSKNDTPLSRKDKINRFLNGNLDILVNYDILTAGFDAPSTNVAIIARPTNSLVTYSQMCGRAMRGRKSKGNLECRIYTVNDSIPEFKNVVDAFKFWDKFWEE